MKCHGNNDLEMNSEKCDSNVREHGGTVGGGTALQSGRSRVRSPMRSFGCSSELILPAALRPWRNVFEEYFLGEGGGKGDKVGSGGLKTFAHSPARNSGNLNRLEP